MAAIRIGAICAAIFSTSAVAVAAEQPVALRVFDKPGVATRVLIETKAEGLFHTGRAVKPVPDDKPAAKKGEAGKGSEERTSFALKVEAPLEYVEKTVAVDKDGAATRSARRILRAGAAINGEVKATAPGLRPEVAIQVAELRDGSVTVHALGGPLLRSELELVQGPADPLALPSLLSAGEVSVGDTWTVGADVARSLAGYDKLTANLLSATLESLDPSSAAVRLKGEVRGSSLGGEGIIKIEGRFTLDRKEGRISGLFVSRDESRKEGPVEAGLDVKSTISMTRTAAEVPAEISDAAIGAISLASTPEKEFLLFNSTDGRYSFIHDRNWYVAEELGRMTVLKRVDGGGFIAQCNLATGPNAGKGRHQDPDQFRLDVKNALGSLFVGFLGAGEVDGAPGGHYRYKVSAQGRQGDVGVLWYYYLVAGPEGDQVVATFTLAADRAEKFADEDLKLIGTFEWKPSP